MSYISKPTADVLLKAGSIDNTHFKDEYVIALAGNPNVGKSTVFNSLTGLNQHTGNWPGKTVANARGRYKFKDARFMLVDIPGTYSLMSNSLEEEVARDFICFGKPDAAVVVADATCLERNLILVLQILEMTCNAVVCVNLMDEARRKKIHIDIAKLSRQLGIPVVGASARSNTGLDELMDSIYSISADKISPSPIRVTYDQPIENAIQIIEPYVYELVKGKINSRWAAIKLLDGDKDIINSLSRYLGFSMLENESLSEKIGQAKRLLEQNGITQDKLRENMISSIVRMGEKISKDVVVLENKEYNTLDRKIDKILTSRIFGIPIMLGLLSVVFWLTIAGANYPSQMIASLLFGIEAELTGLFLWAGMPSWLHSMLVLGVYRTLAWVVSVMLPPMAIFFPLFTLLEDLGYLPRVAFNLDSFFKRACAHGKQALTMCMGFGCNAAGIIGCRIIDSPRERLIAIITNTFVPCNGRFPTLIVISSIFMGGMVSGAFQSLISTLTISGIVLLGIFMTLAVSRILSKTILKGFPSSFTLELPPYRKPQIGRIIVRSILDRTLFVLGRAVCIAAPAGLLIWSMANISIGGISLLSHCAGFLDPFAHMIGLDGYILMAFILGFPANEIVIPIIIMSYMSTGSLIELNSLDALRELLVSHGWTWLTAVCVMLFSLMHFPCGTTLWTIAKETRSIKWTFVSFLLPTAVGIAVCFIAAQTARLLGLV